MYLLRYFFLIPLLYGFASGCTPEKKTPPVFLPFDLQVTIEESTTINGKVNVTATADMANYYSFEFKEGANTKYLKADNGAVSYTFTTSGQHKIIVKAHASFEYYIEDQFTVDIQLDTAQGSGEFPNTGYETPMSYPGYTLVWNDEFQGTTLSNNWTHDIGTGNNGWGNNELQYYRTENTEVREGYLVITAKEENFSGRAYTSSRVKTEGIQNFKYGRIDVRAALPEGQGLWPAIWMLGESFSTIGWPQCGEIDIMEMVGGSGIDRGDDHIFGTAHWDNAGQHADYGNFNKLSSGKYSDEFHVFSIEWDSNAIRWYRDDIKYNEIDITPAELSEFQEAFFFIINIAVGGNWPGNPNSQTQFPQKMAVDYIRVFQK